MKRRNFLKYSSQAAGAAALSINGFSIHPTARLPFFSALQNSDNPLNRVLVLIQLYGGNDGLNTMVPLDQYDKLLLHRKNIMIPEKQLLPLNDSANAFHPAMLDFQDLFNNGLMSIVQNVGYPNQDYSHFRSADIWMSASDTDEYLETGWIGRYLQSEYPGFPQGFPNENTPDPIAIQIGSITTLSLLGDNFPMGFAIADTDSYYRFVNDIVDEVPDSQYGDELKFIQLVSQQAQVYYEVIKKAADFGRNRSALYPEPGENYLADQLKIVAQLISGGLKTSVYIVSLDGFDTHSNQVESASETQRGEHAQLLKMLSQAVGAFQDDLYWLGLDDRVTGMTFSEFGRTIGANGSMGTDHGAAAPLFVFGNQVNPRIIGLNPAIPKKIEESEDLPMQHDFRSVYASVLRDWFGITNPESVLNKEYPILPIFKSSITNTRAIKPNVVGSVSNFPNPFRGATTIRFSLNFPSVVTIKLYAVSGAEIGVIANGYYDAGEQMVRFERNLTPGHYIYLVKVGNEQVSGKMLAL